MAKNTNSFVIKMAEKRISLLKEIEKKLYKKMKSLRNFPRQSDGYWEVRNEIEYLKDRQMKVMAQQQMALQKMLITQMKELTKAILGMKS